VPRALVALVLVAVLAGCRTAAPVASPARSPVVVASATASPQRTGPAPSATPVPLATSTATVWAHVCGTVSDFVRTTTTANGSVILNSPGRSPLKITLTAPRVNPDTQLGAGYICVTLDAGVPRPIFAGLSAPGAEGFIAPGMYPATLAKPAPNGFVVPQACAFVAPPEVGADETNWWVDCGAEANRNARGTLGAALGQQGWTGCGPALGTQLFTKGTLRVVVVESSLAPGDYPRFSQVARPASGCG
jgi:hypothetical protein